MKLLIAILRDQDTERVVQALVIAGFRVTRVASTGGFIRRGSSTIMIGLEESQIDLAYQTIRKHLSPSDESTSKRATLFVLDVAEFSQV
jgi:uncharacterized protein YaaQ